MPYAHVVCINPRCTIYNQELYRNYWIVSPLSSPGNELRDDRVKCRHCNAFSGIVTNTPYGIQSTGGWSSHPDPRPSPPGVNFPFPPGAIPVFRPEPVPAAAPPRSGLQIMQDEAVAKARASMNRDFLSPFKSERQEMLNGFYQERERMRLHALERMVQHATTERPALERMLQQAKTELSCPICMEGYGTPGHARSFLVTCCHIICEGCFARMRSDSDQQNIIMTCPFCRAEIIGTTEPF